MRFLLGLILGVCLAIGVAYVHDSSISGGARAQDRPIVNWESLDANVRALREDVAEGWTRLTGSKRTPEERSQRGEKIV